MDTHSFIFQWDSPVFFLFYTHIRTIPSFFVRRKVFSHPFYVNRTTFRQAIMSNEVCTYQLTPECPVCRRDVIHYLMCENGRRRSNHRYTLYVISYLCGRRQKIFYCLVKLSSSSHINLIIKKRNYEYFKYVKNYCTTKGEKYHLVYFTVKKVL